MTDEQVNDLWLQFAHLHPDRVKSTVIVDDTFDEFAKELEAEAQGVLYDTTEIVAHGEAAPVFVSAAPAKGGEWEDVEF